MYRRDTIVACATPPGRGGVAIVRLSGDQARAIAEDLFRPSRARSWSPRRLIHGAVRDPDRGRTIDEGLLAWMPGPHSFTGEDVVELQVHGSPLVVERIIAAAVRLGARPAERGEFTRRAVLNGRLDLLQAEAVADLIDARVEAGADAAWAQLQGALSQRLGRIREGIVDVLAEVEANVDFSDEELPGEEIDVRMDRVAASIKEIESLLGGFAAARRLRDGYSVVFVGRPNAGKSSLVNALLGTGRMIVSHE
ncbi:MAG: tRNA uridine-5-carboxymethylaminomethyl(34) synthesis GTPase MnmE, partial [Deltaproteobacteria bacterium]